MEYKDESGKEVNLEEAKVYDFDASFSDHVWIDGGRLFNEPLSVALSPKGKVNISIRVYKSDGTHVGDRNTGKFEGGVNFPIGHLTNSGGVFKVKLTNITGQNTQVVLNSGQLYYTK